MADHTRHILQGQLADLVAELKTIELRCDGLVESIHIGVMKSPLATVFELNADALVTHVTDLAAAIKAGQKIQNQIDDIKDRLGIA